MTEKHIGCPDGSTIAISHRGENIVITIEDTKASLSLKGAQKLIDHLNTIVPTRPTVKESMPIPQDQSPSPITTRETLGDLLAEGLIKEGTKLTLTLYDEPYYATVTNTGLLNIDGHKATSPSAACEYVIGHACNGWISWSVKDGPVLADLRWKLRARWFPIKGPHNALSDIQKQQRTIVAGWVDHALSRGLNPGTCDEKNARCYLDERQSSGNYNYKESTLNSYRRHLRQWSEWCKSNNW